VVTGSKAPTAYILGVSSKFVDMRDEIEFKNSIIKTLFSCIPIPGVGQALTEVLEHRSKIKQDRLNQFTELLQNYFSNHQSINLENFQTIEFGDLFESVLKRVVQTKSVEKHKMLKEVLINQLNNPSQNIDEIEIYLDLVSTLSEFEIRILFEYRQFEKKFNPENNEIISLESKIEQLKEQLFNPLVNKNRAKSEIIELETVLGKKRKEYNSLQNIRQSDHFKISNDQYLFFKQRLFSKGLLVDNGFGSINERPFQTMSITQFGVQFIEYILTSELE
jgi:hypothetical protein